MIEAIFLHSLIETLIEIPLRNPFKVYSLIKGYWALWVLGQGQDRLPRSCRLHGQLVIGPASGL